MAAEDTAGGDFNPFTYLTSQGYSPVHAAALLGHMQQESELNPAAVNPKEDAHGLLQWRLDRWDNLKKYAQDRGTDPSDMRTQLDFIRKEMAGPEAKSGARFQAATDLPSASAALKGYIRFGDTSDSTRLDNARRILASSGATPVTPGAGGSGASSVSSAAGAPQPGGIGMLAGSPAVDAGGPTGPDEAEQRLAGLPALMASWHQQNEMPEPMKLDEPRLTPLRRSMAQGGANLSPVLKQRLLASLRK